MRADRRLFLLTTALIGQAGLPGRGVAAPATLDPSDPQAAILGYTPDATKPAPSFAARHADGAHCGNCALFQGKAGDAPGPCPLFGGKLVQGSGWCGSWVAKG
jgi:hypothetical protein